MWGKKKMDNSDIGNTSQSSNLLDGATAGFINCFHMRCMHRLKIISDYIKHLFL